MGRNEPGQSGKRLRRIERPMAAPGGSWKKWRKKRLGERERVRDVQSRPAGLWLL